MPNPAMLFSIALAALQPASPPAQTAAQSRFGRIFISPMGEPFRASMPGDDPLVDWFRQADTNHDGSLSLLEFANDGARFFRTLDTDHDGKIGFDEIHRYEWVVAPEIQVGWSPRIRRAGKNFDAGPRSGAQAESGGDDGPAPDDPLMGLEGAGRFGLLNIPEPVTAADADLDHRVTAAEFTAAASRRFELLDTNHDRRLDLAELEALRPKVSFARNKHHRRQWKGVSGDH